MGLIIHVDGGSRGNPGPSGAGVVIKQDDGTLLHEAGYFLGRQTNNAAEYHATIRALNRAARCGEHTLRVCSDSQLLVRQITGEYEVKSPKLAPLYRQVQMLLLRVKHWSFQHVRREQNRRADQLANLAMDRRRDVLVYDTETGEGEAIPDAAPEADEPLDDEVGAESATAHGAPARLDTTGRRTVRVVLSRPPAEEGCPVAASLPRDFTVGSVLPAALCVHAAHALVPTLLAILSTEPDEFAAVPALTVRCARPGCGATFSLAPVPSTNGD